MPTDVCEMPADAPEVDFADFALLPAAEEAETAMATMAVNLILW